jgi:hypothetical protein
MAVLLVLTSLLLGTCTALIAAPLQLADSGRTHYVISLSSDASAPEKNAASELAYYLNKITGAEFKITTPEQAAGKYIIAIGSGAAKKTMPKLTPDKARLGDDGIVMKSDSTRLVLTGAEGSSRGTLYAVYTFLEDFCGVRWWTQNDNFIPRKPNLAIGKLNISYVPPFRYREALYRVLDAGSINADAKKWLVQAKFLTRSKYNGHFNAIPAEWGGSYNIIGWCHTSEMFMPPSTYFAQHPEWYSEINGKRVGYLSQLCNTNDEMIAELTKNVLSAIEKQPDAGIISVSQNDWQNYCQCAKCSALDKAAGSPSGSLLYCVNKVAEAVEQKYPGFLVETLAYQYTRKPPKTIRPRNNVLIRLAVIERSGVQPIDDPLNKKLMEDLQSWKAAAPNLFIWDYTADMLAAFTTHPNLAVFGPDTRTYAASNVVGVFFEGNHYSGDARGDFDELKIYLMSHLLWNPRQNEKRLIADFLNGYYGKAGPALKQYLDLINAKSRNVWLCSCGGDGDASWMDLDIMNKSTKLFDKAEEAVANDSIVLNRVRRARLQLDHQWLRRYSNYKQAASAGHKSFLGPRDLVSATEAFISRLEAFEGSNATAEGASGLQQYGKMLRARTQNVVNPCALPAQFANMTSDQVIDVQEQDFAVSAGAAIEPDSKASNGFAAKMDPSVVSWAVQFRGIGGLVTSGKWHVYANIRCEKNKDKGIAFTGGIYDMVTAKNLVGLTANLEDTNTAVQVDPNIEQEKTVTSPKGAGDEEYQLYDMGTHNLGGQCYVWFGTTGGVTPENVKAVYIDRIIFVKEK